MSVTNSISQIVIDTTTQTLTLYQDGMAVRTLRISTAKNGTGQLEGSGCTPLGWHQISDKIGGSYPLGSVFVGRQFTGEIYDECLGQAFLERDWILSRILWLEGLEVGVNRGKTLEGILCDTRERYIYIHGTPDTEPMGVPLSHGCIRMRNVDVVWLYDKVAVGTKVLIV
ncbi:L,D-transpeptidase [Moraxella nasovis]|uniref:L,D-transpeptidase n=1 Tax=Moraxella nasovis TaxID=2904121 RepID=UPI001F604D4E|nr:L,D-transpeptidase [Moraxella nasovis]UNU73038.1 L,D-transpeptidase [Moraxella nasovis]